MNICFIKKFYFFVCMYKMLTYSIKTWSKIIGAEAIKHNHEKHLETALGYKKFG